MGVVQLTTVTAINMMGSGIILLPATLAEIGTVSIFAWILASIGATILAYAFAKCGMYSKKVGGMGGYAEYRFGRLGNFLSNYTYAISLIIANVAIATGVVSYGSYVFGFDLLPWKFVWRPSARLPLPLPSALSDRKNSANSPLWA